MSSFYLDPLKEKRVHQRDLVKKKNSRAKKLIVVKSEKRKGFLLGFYVNKRIKGSKHVTLKSNNKPLRLIEGRYGKPLVFKSNQELEFFFGYAYKKIYTHSSTGFLLDTSEALSAYDLVSYFNFFSLDSNKNFGSKFFKELHPFVFMDCEKHGGAFYKFLSGEDLAFAKTSTPKKLPELLISNSGLFRYFSIVRQFYDYPPKEKSHPKLYAKWMSKFLTKSEDGKYTVTIRIKEPKFISKILKERFLRLTNAQKAVAMGLGSQNFCTLLEAMLFAEGVLNKSYFFNDYLDFRSSSLPNVPKVSDDKGKNIPQTVNPLVALSTRTNKEIEKNIDKRSKPLALEFSYEKKYFGNPIAINSKESFFLSLKKEKHDLETYGYKILNNLTMCEDFLRTFSNESDELSDLISKGENVRTEFKESYRYNKELSKGQTKDQDLTIKIVMTVAAMMNSKGGDILLGIAEEGNEVKTLGINLKNEEFKTKDDLKNAFMSIFKDYFGDDTAALINKFEFRNYEGKEIIHIKLEATPPSEPIFTLKDWKPKPRFLERSKTKNFPKKGSYPKRLEAQTTFLSAQSANVDIERRKIEYTDIKGGLTQSYPTKPE
tara:strand:- start:426 stop:2225 length:1800 start_codon:yes stop_codon:yes gene_type:complete